VTVLIYALFLVAAAAINTVADNAGVAYLLAQKIAGNTDLAILLAGLFAGLLVVILYGLAIFGAKKTSNWWKKRSNNKQEGNK